MPHRRRLRLVVKQKNFCLPAYVRELVVTMSSLCAACGVDVPDFTEASDLTGTEFRELGMSLVNQLPG